MVERLMTPLLPFCAGVFIRRNPLSSTGQRACVTKLVTGLRRGTLVGEGRRRTDRPTNECQSALSVSLQINTFYRPVVRYRPESQSIDRMCRNARGTSGGMAGHRIRSPPFPTTICVESHFRISAVD